MTELKKEDYIVSPRDMIPYADDVFPSNYRLFYHPTEHNLIQRISGAVYLVIQADLYDSRTRIREPVAPKELDGLEERVRMRGTPALDQYLKTETKVLR